MKRVGPDSRKSWMIAFVCCFIYMIMDGLQRMSGMLFVATIERFLVTRKQASLPYSLSFSIRFICGPLVGYLGQKFSVRSVAAIGCVLGSIGAGACFFAESIDTVTLLWGLLFGLGNGLANNLLPVSINQHFDKHRATASGISFSGSCLGSFVLAPIFEFLLNNYGLSGTFLLISGFILNCIPAALLLIKPNYDFKKSSKLLSTANGSKNPLGNMKIIENENTALNPYKENIQNKKSYCAEQMKQLSAETLLIKCTSHKNNLESLDLNQQFENCREKSQIDLNLLDSEIPSSSFGNADTDLTTENNETFEKVLLSPCEAYDKSIAYGTLKNFRTLSSEDLNSLKKNDFQGALPSYQNYSYQNSTHDFKQSYITYLSSDPANKNSVRRKDSQFADNTNIYLVSYISNIDVGNNGSTMAFKYIPNCTNIPESKWPHRQNFKIRPNKRSLTLDKPILKSEKTSALKAFSVFFDPMFILIGITYAIYCFDFVCMFTVIVDFARDLNIGNSDEHYILMTMSAGGFVGRLGLGWITDGGFMTKTNFIALCFAVQGFVTVAIVWSNGFTTLMILSTLYGLSDSGIIIILPLMVAQYVDPDKQTVAMATRSIYAGPVCLAVAPLIGYFRDTLKSYNFLLYGVGVVMLLSCFSWFLVPYMERCKRNQ